MSQLNSAQQRLDQAVDRLDAAIRAKHGQAGTDPTALNEELEAVRAENAALASAREQIASRLDSAIDNLRNVLEA